jgi:hypothetical protein
MHEPLLEGTARMNAMSHSTSMVLEVEVGFVPVRVKWLQRREWLWRYMPDA